MLRVLMDIIRNELIRQRTKVTDVVVVEAGELMDDGADIFWTTSKRSVGWTDD